MEEIASLFNSIGLILTAILGGVSVISLSVAALLYMSAHGDPQQVQRAKTAAIGAVIGLILGGLAWVLPGILSRAVIEPAGGQSLTASGGTTGCDQIFRSQLVNQRQINNKARMNELVAVIQNTRDECRRDTWRPVVVDLDSTADLNAATEDTKQSCISGDGYTHNASETNTWPLANVANVQVPIGLRVGSDPDNVPRSTSGRDRDNNIMVYFQSKIASPEGNPPGDGAVCWLYLARAAAWSGAQPSS